MVIFHGKLLVITREYILWILPQKFQGSPAVMPRYAKYPGFGQEFHVSLLHLWHQRQGRVRTQAAVSQILHHHAEALRIEIQEKTTLFVSLATEAQLSDLWSRSWTACSPASQEDVKNMKNHMSLKQRNIYRNHTEPSANLLQKKRFPCAIFWQFQKSETSQAVLNQP